jgi:hypothetical protein
MVHLVITRTKKTAKDGNSYIQSITTQADTQNPKVSRDANGNVMVTMHDFNLSTEDFCETPKRESRRVEKQNMRLNMFFLPC